MSTAKVAAEAAARAAWNARDAAKAAKAAWGAASDASDASAAAWNAAVDARDAARDAYYAARDAYLAKAPDPVHANHPEIPGSCSLCVKECTGACES